MISQWFGIWILPSRFPLSSIAAGLTISVLSIAVVALPSSAQTATTKTSVLQERPRNQSATALGSPVSTNLVGYRNFCGNPQDLSQISPLCVSLGVLTGQNPDDSANFDDLPSEPTALPLSPQEATSTPKFVPIGLIRPDQDDKVQIILQP